MIKKNENEVPVVLLKQPFKTAFLAYIGVAAAQLVCLTSLAFLVYLVFG